MLKKVNEAIIAELQLLNADGSVATGATVTAQVYDESYGAFSTPAVTEIGATGIYKATFTPDTAGLWSITFTCASPATIRTAGFFVQDAITTDIGSILADSNELQTDWVNGGRLDLLIDAIKVMTDKVGTLTNTGGVATLGAIIGDFANSTLIAKLNAIPTTAMRGTDGAALASVWTATRGGYIDYLADATYGLSALHTDIADNHTDIGTLLTNLADLHTDVGTAITNIGTVNTSLGNATYGLSALHDHLALIPTTAMRGTDGAALAATALSNAVWTDAKAGYLTGAVALAASFGTLVNTGGVASVGGIFGDFANVTLVSRLTTVTSDVAAIHVHADALVTDVAAVHVHVGTIDGHITADYGATEKTCIDLLDDASGGLADIHTDIDTAITAIGDVHATDLPAVKVDTAAIKVQTDKIGTIVNTGGVATLGAAIGDIANSSLVDRLGALNTKFGTLLNTGGSANLGTILGDFANVTLVTRVVDLHTDVADVHTDVGTIYTFLSGYLDQAVKTTSNVQFSQITGNHLHLAGLIDGVTTIGMSGLLTNTGGKMELTAVAENSIKFYDGTVLDYIGMAHAADQLVTGSTQGDLVIRTGTRNLLFSMDGGNSISASLGITGNFNAGNLYSYVYGGGADSIGGSLMVNRYMGGYGYRGGAIFSYYKSSISKDVLGFAVSADTTPLDIAKVKMYLDENGNLGLLSGSLINNYMSGDYGIVWGSISLPSGHNGMQLVAYNSNAGVLVSRLYIYSSSAWHYIILT